MNIKKLVFPVVESELGIDLRKKMTDIAEPILAFLVLNPERLEESKRWLSAKKFEGTTRAKLATAVFDGESQELEVASVSASLDILTQLAGEGAGDSVKDILEWAKGIDLTGFDLESFSVSLCDYYKKYIEASIASASMAMMTQGRSAEEVLAAAQAKRDESGAYDSLLDNEDDLLEFERYIEGKFKGVPEAGIVPPFVSLRTLIPIHSPGELVVIAARPGAGKTQYLIDAIRYYSSIGEKGAVFALEMRARALYGRLVQRETGVNLRYTKDLSQYFLLEDDADAFKKAVSDLRTLGVSIDTKSMKLTQILFRLRQFKREKGISFAFIDYVQLIKADAAPTQIREQEIAQITRTLKLVANELGITIFLLAQLNRAAETRGGSKRPQLSDLRESGSLELDSDTVGFIHRPEMYRITEDENGKSLIGMAEFIIAKQREGALGSVWLNYDNILGFSDDEETLRTQEAANVNYPLITKSSRMNEEEVPF